MFVMDYYGHKLSNGVLFAHHLILDVPGGSSHLAYRRRVAICNNPGTRVKSIHQGQCPWEPIKYLQFVFARHSTRRGLPNPGFPPSSFSFSMYSKASPSPSTAFPIIPSPTPTTLDVFPDVSPGEV